MIRTDVLQSLKSCVLKAGMVPLAPKVGVIPRAFKAQVERWPMKRLGDPTRSACVVIQARMRRG